ncbi:NAD(P)-dependent alcohol dehydrogenase [Nocardia sp. CC227C]|uniref:NAD(P)-dependent alcohol dehydrogenase n=1 Tax=Nocardia sp. CC227C TaxID=3044562 RepID=UPI00278C1ED4|nr:NAD(P)-dependent alcohol dehydrogenase [Nocardia sp. CC227C]
MQALFQREYGSPSEVLELREIERPTPGIGEVLVRVRASSVNPADWLTLRGRPYVARPGFGFVRPKHRVPGKDVAGIVEAVGPNVTRFQRGDAVYGELPGGAYGEFAVAAADAVAIKPANLDFAAAAAVPLAGITALQGIHDRGAVRAGQRVLVNGASGGVGTFAIQIAKSLDAHVTGVCSARNLDLVRSIGADEVIDYTRVDFTRGPRRYHLVFDLIGNHTMSGYRRVLEPDGVYVCATGMPGGPVFGPLPYLLRVLLASLRGGPAMRVLVARPTAADLSTLTRLIEDGRVTPVVDRVVPLAEAADALASQGAGHARGKTVITV